MDMSRVFVNESPVVGMVHLPPLPGAPDYDAEAGRASIREAAVRDARRLAEGGVDAVIVENFGDAPFYPEDVPDHVVADMTTLVGAVDRAIDRPVGVNVLRNDVEAALGIAAAAGGSFVRVNVHVGARITDQGIVEGRAHETLRRRDQIDAGDVQVLADVAVKHSRPLAGDENIPSQVRDLVERGLADGVIVSGERTGTASDLETVEEVVTARDGLERDVPVLVGSGVTARNVADFLTVADGVIVGTALKAGGETTAPVDVERVGEVVAAAEKVR